ncbi:uncharacterized protein V6R79_025199 [Siganus canaliculatus]
MRSRNRGRLDKSHERLHDTGSWPDHRWDSGNSRSRLVCGLCKKEEDNRTVEWAQGVGGCLTDQQRDAEFA